MSLTFCFVETLTKECFDDIDPVGCENAYGSGIVLNNAKTGQMLKTL